MKDIGLKLKEKREENGVSIEEVSEDLKMRPSQIISLEEGKKEDFKDVVFLKYFIRDYAKYLGTTVEKIRAERHAEAEKSVKVKLALQEIVKLEKLDVSKEEYDAANAYVHRIANMLNRLHALRRWYG